MYGSPASPNCLPLHVHEKLAMSQQQLIIYLLVMDECRAGRLGPRQGASARGRGASRGREPAQRPGPAPALLSLGGGGRE